MSGAKNSVLKLMAAALLAEGTSVLGNVPRITDVACMAELVASLGVGYRWCDPCASPADAKPSGHGPEDLHSSSHGLELDVPAQLHPVAPPELVESIRASIVLLGPLLARHGMVEMWMPGGDDFGSRPIDFHLGGLERMGATFETASGKLVGRAGRLTGARLVLEYPSHTATDNLMMAAVLAKGTTIIENAAREPEVVDLAEMLVGMGAIIDGAGTSRIVIEGVESLKPACHVVVPDRVEAATLLAAVGLAGGEVMVEGPRAEHMDMLLEKLNTMGVHTVAEEGGLLAVSDGRLHCVDIATLPYPGVATDYKPLLVTMLSVADGVSIVTENLFSGRFRYIEELRTLGADIRTEGHHAVVRGVARLRGATVRASDIRAGAALVLAGLAATGETTVLGGDHIDRGYEDLAGKLASLGADVRREP